MTGSGNRQKEADKGKRHGEDGVSEGYEGQIFFHVMLKFPSWEGAGVCFYNIFFIKHVV